MGAPAVYGTRGYDEAAGWTQVLSLPWVGLAVIAAAGALWKPGRWVAPALGAMTLVHVGLVFFTW